MTIDKALRELFDQTLSQMQDGELPATFDAFGDFTADYPASAWLDDYRRYGGVAMDDAKVVERAVMELARAELPVKVES